MPYSPSDDPSLYGPNGQALPTEERIRRLMELLQPRPMLSEELPPAEVLGADISTLGLEAIKNPFDGNVTYRRTKTPAPAPYVGARPGRG
jgi:hypothetical protein